MLGSILRESSSPANDLRIVALRYGAGNFLTQHQHEVPYVSVLASGKYTELCAANPRRCEVGTVIEHDAAEEHADYFSTDGVCVNIYTSDSAAIASAVAGALRAKPPRDWSEVFDVTARLVQGPIPEALPPRPETPQWLLRVLRDFDWTSTASLRRAAECADVHPAHLSRAFRKYLGTTAGGYRLRARVAAASTRLLTTSASLAQIATETGFYDQSDFTNRFQRASGLPPGHFRSVFQS